MTQPLILHDAFSFSGGGEKVTMSIARKFNGKIITGHIEKSAFPENYFQEIQVSNLSAHQNYPLYLGVSKTSQLWNAFARIPEQSPPWTIFSGCVSLLGAKKISGPKLLYCHTPPRLIYDQKNFYYQTSPPLKRLLLHTFIPFYRKAYQDAVISMDLIVANSVNIRNRLKRFVGISATVIYPPCDTVDFSFLGQEDYYLSTARLCPLKRIDLIINAFSRMPDKKLIITSSGPEEDKLRKAAEPYPNISFTGYISDDRLQELMGKCIATVYIPMDEDFGISPVESMAAGKPVIGVQEGGLMETVIHGETGLLIPANPDHADIIRAVESLSPEKALQMKPACERRASLFSEKRFIENMERCITSVKNGAAKTAAT